MLEELDRELARRYGAYASYATDVDPIRTEAHGDAPADEMDRLLDLFARPECRVLDLGCGAGQTLCRLALRVAEIWGIDCEEPLLAGARARAARLGVKNAMLVLGDTTHADAVAKLPDDTFDFVFSRRGPFLNSMLMPKLKQSACFIQECYQDCLGLKELFGRKVFLPAGGSAADPALDHHIKLGLLPASIKSYFYTGYFRDGDHLAAYLSRGAWLSNWWMPERPYHPARDRAALDLYVRYNTTRHGVQLIQHRKVYLFHRSRVNYYPADGVDKWASVLAAQEPIMNPRSKLTPFQQNLLLSVCPQGSRIVEACYFRREYLPCPVRVVVQGPDGSTRTLVLRITRHGDVEQEARLLSILAEMGLPVPQVLAGPARDADAPGDPAVAVYSLLPGINLQELSQRSSQDCKLAGRLVIEAARQLASLTSRLRAMPQAGFIPTITLRDQLQAVLNKDDVWLRETPFRAAVEKLQRVLEGVPQETVFTSGDYQPGNFLTDGKRLTGFVDFEMASYQDFLFGFAKYPIYDMHPLNKSGFVAFLIEQERIAPRDFDIRLALGCLITLQREIPVAGGDAEYRNHVLALLARSCENLA